MFHVKNCSLSTHPYSYWKTSPCFQWPKTKNVCMWPKRMEKAFYKMCERVLRHTRRLFFFFFYWFWFSWFRGRVSGTTVKNVIGDLFHDYPDETQAETYWSYGKVVLYTSRVAGVLTFLVSAGQPSMFYFQFGLPWGKKNCCNSFCKSPLLFIFFSLIEQNPPVLFLCSLSDVFMLLLINSAPLK